MADPPSVDPPGPGWRRTESASETVLDLGPVEVTTATVVFEDADLRDHVLSATGLDRPWRFAFASRVDVPGGSESRALRRLVTDRARRGFVGRLRDRGFEAVERAGERSFGETTATRYAARVEVEAVAVDAEGWLSVRPDPDRRGVYLLAGGVYPYGIRSAPDETTRRTLAELFDPSAFRRELIAFLRR